VKVLERLKSLSAEEHGTAEVQGISTVANARQQWLVVALPCTNLPKLSNLHIVAADDIVLEKILQQWYIDAINKTLFLLMMRLNKEEDIKKIFETPTVFLRFVYSLTSYSSLQYFISLMTLCYHFDTLR